MLKGKFYGGVPMPALSRRTWIVVAALAAIVAILLFVPYLINLDQHRVTLARMLERQTGKKAEIGGLRFSLLPTLGFVMRDIHIWNPADFPAGRFLEIERIDASVALMPLLSREVQIRSLSIDRPLLNLLVDERGRGNYETKPQDSGRGGQVGGSSTSLFTLGEISDVSVRDATVSYGHISRGRIVVAWRLAGLNADLARLIIDPSRLGELDATLDLKDATVELTGLKEPVKFRSGQITARNNQAEGKCEAALGKTKVELSFRVADLAKPVADFQLHSPEMNLSELGMLAAPARARSNPGTTIERHKLLARGRVSVDRVKYSTYELSALQAQARMFNDAVELSPFSTRLYGGTFSGSLTANLEREPTTFTLDGKIENADTEKALSTPAKRSKVRGRFEASGRVNGVLGGDLLSSLSGSGQFAVRDGVITAFSLSGNLMKIAKSLTLGQGGPLNETPFSFIGGDFRLSGGRIYSEQLKFTSPQLEASAGGSSGFDGTLNYTGWGSLAGAGSQMSGGRLGSVGQVLGTVVRQTVGQMRVPFSIRGTFENPQFFPAGVVVPEKTPGPAQQLASEGTSKPPSPADLFNIFRKKR